MDTSQKIIVGLVLGGFAMAIIATFIVSRQQAAESLPASQARFLAEPGKERENAMGLFMRENDPGEDATRITDQGLVPQNPDGIARVTPEELLAQAIRDMHESGPEDVLASEAMAQADADEGVRMILSQIHGGNQLAASAEVYTALGHLFLAQQEPRPDWAERAFEIGEEMAVSEEKQRARQEAALARAQLLLESGRSAEAIEAAQKALAEAETPTVAGARLHLLLGRAYETEETFAEAADSYEGAIADALQLLEYLPETSGAEGIYRQACLNLARLHRDRGNQSAAERITRAMRTRLGAPYVAPVPLAPEPASR